MVLIQSFLMKMEKEENKCMNCGREYKEHYFDHPSGKVFCYTELTSEEDLIFKNGKRRKFIL